MPRAPARIRKRFVEGSTEVCPWDTEETLLYGITPVFGPPCMFRTLDEWHREWSRWGELILPKCIEHRPGTRPAAMYVLGIIPRRELAMPLPEPNCYWFADVRDRRGQMTRHWLNVPEPFMPSQVRHLQRLGIIDSREVRRYREWMNTANADCDRCAVDTYPLEMSVYE
jgi:hypothetical protein